MSLRRVPLAAAASCAGGVPALALRAFWDGYRAVEDAFERGLTAVLPGDFYAVHAAWRGSGFAPRFPPDPNR